MEPFENNVKKSVNSNGEECNINNNNLILRDNQNNFQSIRNNNNSNLIGNLTPNEYIPNINDNFSEEGLKKIKGELNNFMDKKIIQDTLIKEKDKESQPLQKLKKK